MKRGEPSCKAVPGSRYLWTVLDCQVGNHSGVFTITKTPRGWACPKHMEEQ